MRTGQAARIAGYWVAAHALGARHALRRRRSPAEWTKRDPYRIHWTSPADIVATTTVRIQESLRGRVLDGDWDLEVLPLRSLDLWHGLEQRLIEQRPWSETILDRSARVAVAPNVGTRLTTDDPATRRRRQQRLDALAASLLTDGWLPHHDVGGRFAREMAVGIARDGTLIRNSGGLHRLIIAQLIGLPSVPYRILIEHPDAPAPR